MPSQHCTTGCGMNCAIALSCQLYLVLSPEARQPPTAFSDASLGLATTRTLRTARASQSPP
eukprot:10622764-Heterocapsa_arctica.AAC.1